MEHGELCAILNLEAPFSEGQTLCNDRIRTSLNFSMSRPDTEAIATGDVWYRVN